jgi:hypothetical protein
MARNFAETQKKRAPELPFGRQMPVSAKFLFRPVVTTRRRSA